MARRDRLPVFLLTGFLGSGKTSLLDHVLRAVDFPRDRTAIIVNDFGAVNVDAAILANKVARLAELTAGCLCCTGHAELGRQLFALADDPVIDRVWVEASGVAESDDLLDHLTEPRLLERITIAQVIHVVDASAYPGWWLNRPLAQEQLRWADVVVVNKIDRAKPKVLEKIAADLAAFNPDALRLDATRGAVALPAALATRLALDHVHSETAPHPEPATTLFLPIPKPIPRHQLETLLATAPENLYRAKGFVIFDDALDELCLVQKAADATELTVWKASEATSCQRGLVLLGRQLDTAALTRHFAPISASLPVAQ